MYHTVSLRRIRRLTGGAGGFPTSVSRIQRRWGIVTAAPAVLPCQTVAVWLSLYWKQKLARLEGTQVGEGEMAMDVFFWMYETGEGRPVYIHEGERSELILY